MVGRHLLTIFYMSEIEELLDQCLIHAIHIRNISPLYVQCIRGTYARFLADTGITSLSECTRFRIEQWLLDGRIKKNWAAWTYRTEHKNL